MKKYNHKDTDYAVHITAGMLNFLGGNFKPEDLDNKSFSEVIDSILCNGGHITIGLDSREMTFGKKD